MDSWYWHFNICYTYTLFEKTGSRISFAISICKVIEFYLATTGNTDKSTDNKKKALVKSCWAPRPWLTLSAFFFQFVTCEIMLLFDAILTIKIVADGKTYSTFRYREPGERSEYGVDSMGWIVFRLQTEEKDSSFVHRSIPADPVEVGAVASDVK
jgi:hypothetical protein